MSDEESEEVGEWVATADPISGNYYYFHTVENITQWEKPEDFGGRVVRMRDDGTVVDIDEDGKDVPLTEEEEDEQIEGFYEDEGEADEAEPEAAAEEAKAEEPAPAAGGPPPVPATASRRKPKKGGGLPSKKKGGGLPSKKKLDAPALDTIASKSLPPEATSNPNTDMLADTLMNTNHETALIGEQTAPDEPRLPSRRQSSKTDPSPRRVSNLGPPPFRPLPERRASSASMWKKVPDPSTGKHYYFHLETRQTQWDPPPGWNEEDVEDEEKETFTPNYFTRASQLLGESDEEDSPNNHNTNPTPKFETNVNESSEEETSSEDWVTQRASAKKTFKDKSMRFLIPPTQTQINLEVEMDDEEEAEEKFDILSIDDYEDSPKKWANHAKDNEGKFKFASYASDHFGKQKKSFSKSYTTAELCAWQPAKLSKPLRKSVPPELAKESVQAFRHISGFMGDRRSKKEPLMHVENLMKQAFKVGDEVRDEMYCLIMKQCTENPKEPSLKKGFQLFSIFTGTFPPSSTLAPYVVAFLHAAARDANNANQSIAKFALDRFDKTMVAGARKYIPSQTEVNCVIERKPVSLRIIFRDKTQMQVLVRSQTKAEKVVGMICETLSIDHPQSYGLYQFEDTPEPGTAQRQMREWRRKNKNKVPTKKDLIDMLHAGKLNKAVSALDRILDVAAENEWLHTSAGGKRDIEILFAPKVTANSQQKSYGRHAWRLAYAEANNLVIQGYAGLKKEEAFDLASMQVACVHGAQPTEYFTNGLLVKELHRYLPWDVLENEREPLAAEVKILTKHAAYSKFSKTDACREYCRRLADFSDTFYGCTFFPAVLISRAREDVSKALTLAISERGIVILNRETWEVDIFYKLEEILSYGFKKESFLFVGGRLLRQRRYNFLSKQAKEMNDLLLSYINLKVAEQQLKNGGGVVVSPS